MIKLSQNIEFPPHHLTDVHGILAYGGDLQPERLKLAYELGIFPWFNPNEPILWWFPDPRFVLFPDEVNVSKSMRKVFRDEIFTFTENKNFEEVIRNCSQINRPDQEGTWITEAMIEAYMQLHKMGLAKSVEVWKNDELVGGFYGVEGKNMFCGESMFTKVSNASKAGFIYFVQKYANRYQLIDCQVYTEHLESLGAREISAQEFISFL